MSQPSPFSRLEVLGKSVAGKADHHKQNYPHTADGAHGAASSGSQQKSVALVGTGVLTRKNTAASGADGNASPPQRQTSPLAPQPHQQAMPRNARAANTNRSTNISANAVSGSSNAIELSLVQNLKQQVACLEAQLRVMKQQKEAAARSHALKAEETDGEAILERTTDVMHTAGCGYRGARGVTLPLPHSQRVHHADAAVAAAAESLSTNAYDVEIRRLRRIPEAYQLERSALQHNVESLSKDVKCLQSLALDVSRERDALSAEVVQLRSALREAQAGHAAVAAECAATLRLLESERALRRAAEEDAAVCAKDRPSAGVREGSHLATVDAVSQRDYYRLQSDRLKGSVAREKARAESLATELLQERVRSSAQEKQLCSALDRIALMERRDHQLAAYYQNLSSRFVTVSAMLRHVLDVVPENLLQEKRIPSPERIDVVEEKENAEGEDKVTLDEVRKTLEAWQKEVLTNAVQLKHATRDAECSAPEDAEYAEEASRTAAEKPAEDENVVPIYVGQDEELRGGAPGIPSFHSRTSTPDVVAVATLPSFTTTAATPAAPLQPAALFDGVFKETEQEADQDKHVEYSPAESSKAGAEQKELANLSVQYVSASPPLPPLVVPQEDSSHNNVDEDRGRGVNSVTRAESNDSTGVLSFTEAESPAVPEAPAVPADTAMEPTPDPGDPTIEKGNALAEGKPMPAGEATNNSDAAPPAPPQLPDRAEAVQKEEAAACLSSPPTQPMVTEKEEESVKLDEPVNGDAPKASATVTSLPAATELPVGDAQSVVVPFSSTEVEATAVEESEARSPPVLSDRERQKEAAETKMSESLSVETLQPAESDRVDVAAPASTPKAELAGGDVQNSNEAAPAVMGSTASAEDPAPADKAAPFLEVSFPTPPVELNDTTADVVDVEVRAASASPTASLDDAAQPPTLPPLVAVVPPSPPPTFTAPPPVFTPVPVSPPPSGVTFPLPPSGVFIPSPPSSVPIFPPSENVAALSPPDSVPAPPPPSGVPISVPVFATSSGIPSVSVPTNSLAAAPTPPTLEEQLSRLEARIDAQSTALEELLLKYRDSA